MDNINLPLFNELKDRILWFDGDSVYKAEDIIPLMKQGISVKWVNKITPDIKNYNRLSQIPIKVKEICNNFDVSWNLPSPYDNLNPIPYIIDKHSELIVNMSEEEQIMREERLADELVKYNEMELMDVLRAIIYIINTLTLCNAIWGIGRGSSVSSYVLYIIGVHDVDSFAYELDIDDFLHE